MNCKENFFGATRLVQADGQPGLPVRAFLVLVCVLALSGLAQARNGGPGYGLPPDRSTRNTFMFHEMQRRAYEQDQEWRRRDDEQRRRTEDERQREMWRRDEDRRRENARQQDERTRDWEQRRAYEEQRQERFQHDLQQRDEQKQKGGAYREPAYTGKPLAPKELRRYELIKPGERP
jgi:membrane protein involved in colicin uptake